MMIRYLIFFLLITCCLSCQTQPGEPYVLLVSFDGFRHDYVDLYNTPNFDEFIENGTAAESLIPSFPSKTFPNHYTLVTGLYPGNHGLVDNTFYDKQRDKTYTSRNRQLVEDTRYYGGMPLWQLVQDHGMKSASYFWVGSEAPVAGRFPDYYFRYDGKVPNEQRITAVMEWFQLPTEDRPQFVSLYFSLVDSQGHRTGPESEETAKTVEEADRLLGLIVSGIARLDIGVHVILTSDHGMFPVTHSKRNVLEIPNIIDPQRNDLTVIMQDTHTHLYVEDPDDIDDLYTELINKKENFRVFRKSETPMSWHYSQHDRIGDILLVADAGYIFSENIVESIPNPGRTRGVHGYDPYTTFEMGGIFYAAGPRIKSGYRLNAFENVHIYPLIAQLLGIDPPATDGDVSVLEGILMR